MKDGFNANQSTIKFDGVCRPINDSLFNRFCTIAAVKLLHRLQKRSGRTLFLTGKICVKYSKFISLSEAVTMKFISENTTVPVPKVICAFMHRSTTYIVMQRIPGKMLAAVWPTLSEDSRRSILAQLKGFVSEIRELKPTQKFEGVANVAGGPLHDPRLPRSDGGFGPFETVQEFHKFLRNGLERLPNLEPEVDKMIELQDGPWQGPVFTHGDLSSLNVLVEGDKITGIIDWETSGWYPHYWEFTTAHQVNAYNLFWKDEIEEFLEPMPKELAMDQTRNKYFGDIG